MSSKRSVTSPDQHVAKSARKSLSLEVILDKIWRHKRGSNPPEAVKSDECPEKQSEADKEETRKSESLVNGTIDAQIPADEKSSDKPDVAELDSKSSEAVKVSISMEADDQKQSSKPEKVKASDSLVSEVIEVSNGVSNGIDADDQTQSSKVEDTKANESDDDMPALIGADEDEVEMESMTVDDNVNPIADLKEKVVACEKSVTNESTADKVIADTGVTDASMDLKTSETKGEDNPVVTNYDDVD